MATPVQICNFALASLGEAPISSIEDPKTDVEQLMQLYYPLLRDATLEEKDWSFATRRLVLEIVDVSNDDHWGYGNSFTVPNDLARVIDVRSNPNDNAPSNFEWRFEDRKIICDANKIYIRYIIDNIDPSTFSPMFVQALAARIAAEACIPITENVGLSQQLWNVFANKLAEAKTNDSLQGKSQQIHATKLMQVR